MQSKKLTGCIMEHITSKDNSAIKRLAKLVSSKKERDAAGLFVCEGARLCIDGVKSGYIPCELFVTVTAAKKYPEILQIADKCAKTAVITDALAGKISDTGTTQGVFAVFKRLDNDATAVKIKNGGKYVLLSSLQDPGNVGTIMRTCEAFGIDGLIVSCDCPDIYSGKVLRASMGAVFRLPVLVSNDINRQIHLLRQGGTNVLAAALAEDAVPVSRADFSGTAAVVIGNEGSGLEPETVSACNGTVIIPMSGGAESLNASVAAAILVWEMTRQK